MGSALLVAARAAVLLAFVSLAPAEAQQRADLDFAFANPAPAHSAGSGPLIGIDAGHHNFHTADGRFAPFAALARGDGFRVVSHEGTFDQESLEGFSILVIANALHESNAGRWALPTPSAFSNEEIETLRCWVFEGGSLLLIADHMPFAGAAADLGRAFGFGFVNGYATRVTPQSMTLTFSPDLSAIGETGIGATGTVKTFAGQAFSLPEGAHSILTLEGPHMAFMPFVAGRFDEATPLTNVTGYSQGAVSEFGEGRIAAFGEAAAFTAQIGADGARMGMNAPGAEGNAPLVLAILRWLSG